MTEAILKYVDGTEEKMKVNYTKTREGWLEIAVNKDKPHKRVFIPSHVLLRVDTTDFGEDNLKGRD